MTNTPFFGHLRTLIVSLRFCKKGSTVFVVFFSLFMATESSAQSFYEKVTKKNQPINYNPQYIKSYADKFTSRMYFSQKYTDLTITDELNDFELVYKPNSTLNLGVGATVNSLSLNLAYHFKFLNPENKKGETKNLDLQAHIYSRRWVVDLFAQFYKGLYLENTQDLSPDYPEPYYTRGDIYQQLLGGSVLYLFNNKKFSYRAPFIQNERQLKSAGSFLLGGEASYGIVNADSALLPSFDYELDLNEMDSISRFSFIKIGPSVGYVYSLILAKRFFATLSLTINTSYGNNVLYHDTRGNLSNAQVNFGAIARWALGYNDDNWYLGFTSVNASVSSANKDRSMTSNFGVGNYRLNFVWRFNPGPKLKRYKDIIP